MRALRARSQPRYARQRLQGYRATGLQGYSGYSGYSSGYEAGNFSELV
ncbi:hypothetical protein EMIT048CA2_160101 [Pseudomonas chlororaphis]